MKNTWKNMVRNCRRLNLWDPHAAVLRWVIFCAVIGIQGRNLSAQPILSTYPAYGLEVEHDNVIHNAGHLDAFLEKLYQLHQTGEGHVNIVHVGDSHIQADYMTSVVRTSFHRDFGNAGRGLIVPLRVAGSNEPNNYRTSTKSTWRSKRCVFPDQPLPIGIGGVTIESIDPEANLQIVVNDPLVDYSFNALTLYFQKDDSSFDFALYDPEGNELGRINAAEEDTLVNHSRLTWDNHVKAINIRSVMSHVGQKRAIIYGAILNSSRAGVFYHTIGVNGAKYKHYNAAKYFADQTATLNADLFIISLGTNESAGYPYMDSGFPTHINDLLTTLQTKNPGAAFILVTPQDVFRKRNKPNPGIRDIRDRVLRYAVENGLAFYDLYRAMGGEHSAQRWADNALLSRDGLHLTRQGYEYQGYLFYNALMKSYNGYVPDRHP